MVAMCLGVLVEGAALPASMLARVSAAPALKAVTPGMPIRPMDVKKELAARGPIAFPKVWLLTFKFALPRPQMLQLKCKLAGEAGKEVMFLGKEKVGAAAQPASWLATGLAASNLTTATQGTHFLLTNPTALAKVKKTLKFARPQPLMLLLLMLVTKAMTPWPPFLDLERQGSGLRLRRWLRPGASDAKQAGSSPRRSTTTSLHCRKPLTQRSWSVLPCAPARSLADAASRRPWATAVVPRATAPTPASRRPVRAAGDAGPMSARWRWWRASRPARSSAARGKAAGGLKLLETEVDLGPGGTYVRRRTAAPRALLLLRPDVLRDDAELVSARASRTR